MNDHERYEALTDLLEFCRDPQQGLSTGRQLGPVLLGEQCPRPDEPWTPVQDYTLAAHMSELLKTQLVSSRQMAGLATPASASPVFHRHVLQQDIDPRHGELPFWSVLWAYYICHIPADEIGRICGWDAHQSYMLVERGRRMYLPQKLAELDRETSSANQSGNTKRGEERISIDARDQRISGNTGIAINGNVSDGSKVEQHTFPRRRGDAE